MDPLLGDMSNPQRLNRYAYVGNNPVNIVDPDGREWVFVRTRDTWRRVVRQNEDRMLPNRLGRFWVAALSPLVLTLSSAETSEGILGGRECGDPDGYAIRHQTEFLRAERFTLEWLVPHFRRIDESVEATEHYVFSFSDEEYLANIHVPRLILPGGPDPARFTGPAAHFFRIGENAFFQFESAEGRIHWHVLEGRNTLSGEVLPGIKVIYVGQSLLYYPPLELRLKAWREHVEVPNPCEEGSRSLHLVVPDWSEESIRKLADYYDALFPVPSSIAIYFSSDFEWARVFGGVVGFASLEAMAAGFPDLTGRTGGKSAYFDRVREGEKIIDRGFGRLDP